MNPATEFIPPQIPRAQREQANSQVLERLRLARETVELLAHEGHQAVDVLVAGDILRVAIAASARLADLVERGRAVYFMRGVDETGLRYRKGILLGYENAVVTWIERGH